MLRRKILLSGSARVKMLKELCNLFVEYALTSSVPLARWFLVVATR